MKMPMDGVNISINKKQHNGKVISEKKATTSSDNSATSQSNVQNQQLVETEEFDLNDVKENSSSVVDFLGEAWDNVADVGSTIANAAESAWDATTDFVVDAGTKITNGFNSAVSTVGDIATGAWETVSDWGSSAIDWMSDGVHSIKQFTVEAENVLVNATEKINEILQVTGATVATVFLGIVEGLGEFVEAIVDVGAILLGGVCAIGTGLVDLVAYFGYGESLGLTEQMFAQVMGFVSEQWVSGAFDMFYEDTGVGKAIADNALGFETVRGVTSGIGYALGIIALTAATCGVGTAPTIASAVSSTAVEGAVIAGVAGTGKGAEEAWRDGASFAEGLGYAGVRGIYEGVSYFAGAKMAGVTLGSGTSFVSKIATSAMRVGFDSLDGGLSGVIDPASKMIYNDKSYSEIFEENGGWQTVATNAVIGGGMSMMGEITDNVKLKKNGQPSQIAQSEVDFNLNGITNFDKVDGYFGGKEIFGNEMQNNSRFNTVQETAQYNPYQYNPYNNLRIERAPYIDYIDHIKFCSETADGLRRLADYYRGLKKTYQNDSTVSKRLHELGVSQLVVTDIDIANSHTSYHGRGYVIFGSGVLNNKNYDVFFHETGHFSDWLTANYNIGIRDISKIRNDYGAISVADVERLYRDGYELRQRVENYLQNSSEGKKEMSEIVNRKMSEIIDIDAYTSEEQKKIYRQIYNDVYYDRHDHYLRKSGMTSIEDIMDAMTDGKFKDTYPHICGHGGNYYSRPNIYATEILANFSDLYFNKKTDLLETYFSKEFVKELEKVHNKVVGLDNFKFDYSNENNKKLITTIRNAQIKGTDKALFEILEEWAENGTITPSMQDKMKRIGVNPQVVYDTSPFQVYGMLDDYQQDVNSFLKKGETIMKRKYPKVDYNATLKEYMNSKNETLFTRDYNLRGVIKSLTNEQLQKYINTIGGTNE